MELTEDQKERIGLAVDKIDNYVAGLAIPMPPGVHVTALRDALPSAVRELKIALRDIGFDAWDFDPDLA